MAKLTDMPTELIERVLRYVVRTWTALEARQTCYSMCTVSPRYTKTAKEALYRDVCLVFGSKLAPIRQFRRALEQNPSLSPLLRTLTIIERSPWQPSSNLPAQLGSILLRCSRLQHVRLEPVYHWIYMNQTTTIQAKKRAYADLWSTLGAIHSFTLVLNHMQQIFLLPARDLESITIELSREWPLSGLYAPIDAGLLPKRRVDRLALAGPRYGLGHPMWGRLTSIYATLFATCQHRPMIFELADCELHDRALNGILRELSPDISKLVLTRVEVETMVQREDGLSLSIRITDEEGLRELESICTFEERGRLVEIVAAERTVTSAASDSGALVIKPSAGTGRPQK